MKTSLHHLTASDVSAEELIDIAAEVGADFVCSFVRTPRPLPYQLPIIDSVARGAALCDRARAAGISFCTADTYVIDAGEPEDYEPTLAIAQAAGARFINCIYRVGDLDSAVRKLSRFAALADHYEIQPIYEWSRFSLVTTLAGSVDLLHRCDMPSLGLNADILHLIRNGEGPEDLLKVDPRLLVYAQLCDGPLNLPADRMLEEAVRNRQLPGEGEFPLRAFVDNLPVDAIIAAEAPAERLIGTLSALERARRAVTATRAFLRRDTPA